MVISLLVKIAVDVELAIENLALGPAGVVGDEAEEEAENEDDQEGLEGVVQVGELVEGDDSKKSNS